LKYCLGLKVAEVGSVMEHLFSGKDSRIASDLATFCDHLKAQRR
jgi:hypothetical protein